MVPTRSCRRSALAVAAFAAVFAAPLAAAPPVPASAPPPPSPRPAAATAGRPATAAPGAPAAATWTPAVAPRAELGRALREELRAAAGPRAYLGISLVEIGPELRAHWGAPGDAGVLVGFVAEGSPAAAADLHVGDVLVAIDGEKVATPWDVSGLLRGRAKGDRVRLDVRRDGRNLALDATLDEREGLAPRDGDVLRFKLPEGAFGGEPVTLVAPECADLGRRLGACIGAAAPPAAEQVRERRGEIEKRVAELESRLRDLEKELEERDR